MAYRLLIVLAVIACERQPKEAWLAPRPGGESTFFRQPHVDAVKIFEASSPQERVRLAVEGLTREPPSQEWIERVACMGDGTAALLDPALSSAEDWAVAYILRAAVMLPPSDDELRLRLQATGTARIRRMGNEAFRTVAQADLDRLSTVNAHGACE